jgi:murein L,D-transpeptidase YafK
MLELLKVRITYQLKKAQFWFQTWHNKRQIIKVYEPRVPRPKLRLRIPLKALIWTASVVVAVMVGIYQGPLVVQAIKNRPQRPKVQRPVKPPVVVAAKAKAVPSSSAPLPREAAPLPAVTQTKVDTARLAQLRDSVKAAAASSLWQAPLPMQDIILANKATGSMYLLVQKAGSWQIERTYVMASGASKGPKQNEGDQRTPEGTYFIVGRKEQRELDKIYGPLAYVLNYPNQRDKQQGRSGQGIWIHGTSPKEVPVSTRGCLELNNRDLQELSTLLKMGIGTPVIIIDSPELSAPLNHPDYPALAQLRLETLLDFYRNQAFVVDFIERWRAAWQDMDMKRYSSCYDTSSFKGQGMNWAQWRAHKTATFGRYKAITVETDNILVTELSDGSAVVKFMQVYKSNLSLFRNAKQLSLRRSASGWHITFETTFPQEELLL